MEVKIVQPSVDIAGDLEFTQPRFHFGQVLENLKGQQGFVIGMEFDGEWSYTLFYKDLMVMSTRIKEEELATSSSDAIAVESKLILPPID